MVRARSLAHRTDTPLVRAETGRRFVQERTGRHSQRLSETHDYSDPWLALGPFVPGDIRHVQAGREGKLFLRHPGGFARCAQILRKDVQGIGDHRQIPTCANRFGHVAYDK